MALPTKTNLTLSRTCNAKTPKHTSFVFSVPKNVLFPALETQATQFYNHVFSFRNYLEASLPF